MFSKKERVLSLLTAADKEMALLAVVQIGQIPDDVQVAQILNLFGEPLCVAGFKDMSPEQYTEFGHGLLLSQSAKSCASSASIFGNHHS